MKPMQKRILLALTLAVLAFTSCQKECEHPLFSGDECSIISFTLTQGENEYHLPLKANTINFNAPHDFDYGTTIQANVLLSDGATISPDPATITDWSGSITFTVTSANDLMTTEYSYATSISEYSNIYDGVITLTTQEEVDALKDIQYTEVYSVMINSLPDVKIGIHNLEALNSIKSINSVLSISGFHGETLGGLENLESAGTIEISNDSLKILSFRNLHDINNLLIGRTYDDTRVTVCLGMENVDLPKLEVVKGDLLIRAALNSLNGFSMLKKVDGALEIDTFAETLEGLEGLESLSNLTILGSSLNSLKGLDNLKTIENTFTLINTYTLKSLDGLGLENVSDVIIRENQALADISALENVESLNALNIYGCQNLASLEGLHNIKSAGVITLGFVGMVWGKDGLQDLNGFRGLEEVDNLTIGACSMLKSFAGLEKLTRVNNNLDIHACSSVTSLKGLENIEEINGYFTLKGTKIGNLDEISNLKTVGGAITISENYNLNDFCAVSEVLSSKSALTLLINNNGYNPSLDDLKEGKCYKGNIE